MLIFVFGTQINRWDIILTTFILNTKTTIKPLFERIELVKIEEEELERLQQQSLS